MLSKSNLSLIPKESRIDCYIKGGQWDASDVLSVSLLKILAEKYKFNLVVTRTNNVNWISFKSYNAIACGVGDGPYTFRGTRIYRDLEQKYPYNTFGLLLREFGSLLCIDYGGQLKKFDEEFAKIIDWASLQNIYEDTLSYILLAFKPSWESNRNLSKDESINRLNNSFFTALDVGINLLKHKFDQISSASRVYKILDGIYTDSRKDHPDSRYLVLSEPLPWIDWAKDHQDIRYYIYETQRGGWIIQLNPTYIYRLNDVKEKEIDGVVFIHYSGSLVVCKTLSSAISFTEQVESNYLFKIKVP